MAGTLTASLSKRFPGGPVIRAENLVIPCDRPSITVLFGPSGSGKTTILRCLAGLESPESGSIRYGSELWFDHGTSTFQHPQQRNSVRNTLAARVVAVYPGSPLTRVELDAGFPLFAFITRPACDELELRPGVAVTALIKAPAVHLISRAS